MVNTPNARDAEQNARDEPNKREGPATIDDCVTQVISSAKERSFGDRTGAPTHLTSDRTSEPPNLAGHAVVAATAALRRRGPRGLDEEWS